MKTIQAWIARDMDDTLWLYLSEPLKVRSQWVCSIGSNSPYPVNNLNFPNIKWEDEEPTEVEITIKVKQHEKI